MAGHVCPVWIGYLLLSPLRKLFQDPDKMLRSDVKPGMTVVDIGSAMGYFTLPLARMVGPEGKVVAVDLQQRMLKALRRRATKAGLADRIATHQCPAESLGLDNMKACVDFVLLMAVVHEMPNPAQMFSEVASLLKPGAKVLLAEPKGHISAAKFAKTVALAEEHGLTVVETPQIGRSRAVILQPSPPCGEA